ncbi:MAG: PBP1A family penicillin-binding protein [Gemmatimonadota bacterium]|nr:MAG: PBP1A family penicillin-binding protein [Gemmatimonadota bacterium]
MRRARQLWSRIPDRERWLILTVAAALGAFGLGLLWGGWSHLCDDCPSIAQIYAFEPKEATRVYAGDGSLLAELAIERRIPVAYGNLPAHVPLAFVAVEDRRFWQHRGIDPWRTFRATVNFAIHGYGGAGGSSITQQLAGNMFAQTVDRREISVRRKLREMKVALSLEHAYTKEEILEAYLNQINFDGVYGVQSAAQHYFGKDAPQLNLPEAALLAALPRAPARYSPVRHPERALARRNLILGLMEEQGMISEREAELAKAFPILLREGARRSETSAYFVEWVRRLLIDRYGMEMYEAGFRVYTGLDPGLQAAADSALHAQLEWVERQPGFAAPTYRETRDWPEDSLQGPEMPYVQGSFVALEANTGAVLAMVGGRDFRDSEFDRVTQALRQPGSVFKPFVYTAAIESGMPASAVIYDTPVQVPLVTGEIYSPKNFTDTFIGPITLREALFRSINVVAVKLGLRIGLETVAQTARRLGIRTEVPRVPSVSIGAASVIPLQVTEAYTTFATQGFRVAARPILRIEDSNGRTIWESRVERERVLDEQTAYVMTSMLRDVVDAPFGTGTAVRRLGLPEEVPAAGKTGTTNEATNTWFVGFTPDIVATTWIGFDRPVRIHTGATGGRDAAPVSAQALVAYYRDREPPPDWPRPDGLVERRVDPATGLLATEWCPVAQTYTETYIAGTEPVESCDLHLPWGIRQRARGDSLPEISEDFDW